MAKASLQRREYFSQGIGHRGRGGGEGVGVVKTEPCKHSKSMGKASLQRREFISQGMQHLS